jgi:6-phosphogluconolactonase
MTFGKWARLILMATPLLAGCKDFWKAPVTTTPSGSNGGVFYVLNQKTNQVAAFSIVSGTVTAVTGSPYTLAAVPYAIAIAPGGGYLYVSTASGIYLYTIGTGGALTIGNGGNIIASEGAYAMQVDASGTWLVEAVSGVGTLNAVPIVAASGLYNSSQTEQTVALPATTVQQLAVSPASSTNPNPYVFVALGSAGTAVVPFTAANKDPFGAVSRIATISTQGGANAVAVDPTNRLLYVGETAALSGTQSGGLSVFTIGSTITEISGSPFATGGTGPSAILPTADNVYVANKAVGGSSTGNITGFSISATGTVFSLTLINTIASGAGTIGLAKENTSTYLLAVSAGGNPDLSTYTFDTTTAGKLVASSNYTTGTDPVQAVAIVAAP